jgi:hypothetical protein
MIQKSYNSTQIPEGRFSSSFLASTSLLFIITTYSLTFLIP